MRIVNICYNTGLGGLESVFKDTTDFLQQAGHEVLCVLPPNALLLDNINAPTITNRVLNYKSFIKQKICGFTLHRQLLDFKPDIIITHNGRMAKFINSIAPVNCKTIGYCHGGNIKKLIGLNLLICVNKQLVKQAQNLGHNNTIYLPNWVEVPKNINRPQRDIPVIGTFSRLTIEKDLATFIEAIKILKSNNLNFKVKIAGNGPEIDNLKAQARGLDIDFVGWVADKTRYFESIDIFCQTSLSESFGISMLEAMAYKLPVVVTKTTGAKQILGDNYKHLCELGDIESVAGNLEDILLSSTLRNSLGKRMHNITQQFCKNKAKQKLLDIINTKI